jgi:hypothetical protein
MTVALYDAKTLRFKRFLPLRVQGRCNVDDVLVTPTGAQLLVKGLVRSKKAPVAVLVVPWGTPPFTQAVV